MPIFTYLSPGPDEEQQPPKTSRSSGEGGESGLQLTLSSPAGKGVVFTPRRLQTLDFRGGRKRRPAVRKQRTILLQGNPGAACLPPLYSCCRSRWGISCCSLKRRHLSTRKGFQWAAQHCRPQAKLGPAARYITDSSLCWLNSSIAFKPV